MHQCENANTFNNNMKFFVFAALALIGTATAQVCQHFCEKIHTVIIIQPHPLVQAAVSSQDLIRALRQDPIEVRPHSESQLSSIFFLSSS